MILIIRKFLITFLLVLQLFVPLVHAHVGGEGISFSHQALPALHLPGLEIYGVDQHSLAFQAILHPSDSDGLIVGVNAGINDVAKHTVTTDNRYFLPQQTIIFKSTLPLFDNNFSPQVEPIVCRLLLHIISPRAPPAL